MNDMSPEFHEVEQKPEFTKLDLLQEGSHLFVRDLKTYEELRRTLRLIEPQAETPLYQITQEQSLSVNASLVVHRLDENGEPTHAIKIFPENRLENRARERDWHLLLKKNGVPEGRNGPVSIAELDLDKSQGRVLVTNYEVEDLDKEATIEDYLARALDGFDVERRIKPTSDNTEVFPHKSITPLERPQNLLPFADERFDVLQQFLEKTRGDLLEGAAIDTEETQALIDDFDDDQITQKLADEEKRILQKYKDELTKVVDESLICITNGDPQVENENYRKVGETTGIMMHDGEYAEFRTQLFSVAQFVNHPMFRNMFTDVETYHKYSKKFLIDYARRAQLNEGQIKQLNTLVALSHLVWESAMARNISVGRQNWAAISGGIFKSRIEAVRVLDYPILKQMVTDGPPVSITEDDIQNGGAIIPETSGFNELTSAVSGGVATTKYDRWVRKIVGENENNWFRKAGKKLKELGIPTWSKRELADNPPYIMGEVQSAKELSKGKLFLVMQKFGSLYVARRFGFKAKDQLTGMFGYLAESEQKRQQEGNLLLVITENPDETPKQEKKEAPFVVNEELISKIRDKIPEAEQLCSNLARLTDRSSSGKSEIKDFRVADENNKYFTVVTLIDSHGNEYPVLLYKENGKHNAGGVFVMKDNTGNFVFVENKRVITRARDSRKTSDKTEVEFARDFLDDESAITQELGLRESEYKKTRLATIKHDTETTLASMNVYLIEEIPDVNKTPRPKVFGYELPTVRDGLETIRRDLTLSEKEAEAAIKKGIVMDSMTKYAFYLAMRDKLSLDAERASGKFIAFEQVFDVARADYTLRLPRGSRSKGVRIANQFKDDGKARDDDQISLATQGDLKNNKNIVYLSLDEVKKKLDSAEFDVITAGAIISGLFHEKYFRQ